jgi:hypothetical protein
VYSRRSDVCSDVATVDKATNCDLWAIHTREQGHSSSSSVNPPRLLCYLDKMLLLWDSRGASYDGLVSDSKLLRVIHDMKIV